MWNWSTRLFITEAQANRTVEEKTDGPYKYTKEELAALEKHLIEHETWLNIHVEKQKAVPMNEDPVIETSEMKRRADELSQELQRLVRRRAPVKPKKSKSTTATGTTTSSEAEDASSKPSTSTSTPSDTPDKHDEL
jgi:hypoxia up-regulated 1